MLSGGAARWPLALGTFLSWSLSPERTRPPDHLAHLPFRNQTRAPAAVGHWPRGWAVPLTSLHLLPPRRPDPLLILPGAPSRLPPSSGLAQSRSARPGGSQTESGQSQGDRAQTWGRSAMGTKWGHHWEGSAQRRCPGASEALGSSRHSCSCTGRISRPRLDGLCYNYTPVGQVVLQSCSKSGGLRAGFCSPPSTHSPPAPSPPGLTPHGSRSLGTSTVLRIFNLNIYFRMASQMSSSESPLSPAIARDSSFCHFAPGVTSSFGSSER